jgi:hypothetical protein
MMAKVIPNTLSLEMYLQGDSWSRGFSDGLAAALNNEKPTDHSAGRPSCGPLVCMGIPNPAEPLGFHLPGNRK